MLCLLHKRRDSLLEFSSTPSTWRSLLRDIQLVQPGHVLVYHFVLVLRRHPSEISGDDFAGFGPAGIGMRIVRRPHQVVHPDEFAVYYAHPVIDKGGVHLAVKIGAGSHVEVYLVLMGVAGVSPIQPFQEMGDPADVSLGKDELEAGMTLQHAPYNNVCQRQLHLVGYGHVVAGAEVVAEAFQPLDVQAVEAFHRLTAACKDVQADGKIQLRGRRPEWIETGVT